MHNCCQNLPWVFLVVLKYALLGRSYGKLPKRHPILFKSSALCRGVGCRWGHVHSVVLQCVFCKLSGCGCSEELLLPFFRFNNYASNYPVICIYAHISSSTRWANRWIDLRERNITFGYSAASLAWLADTVLSIYPSPLLSSLSLFSLWEVVCFQMESCKMLILETH